MRVIVRAFTSGQNPVLDLPLDASINGELDRVVNLAQRHDQANRAGLRPWSVNFQGFEVQRKRTDGTTERIVLNGPHVNVDRHAAADPAVEALQRRLLNAVHDAIGSNLCIQALQVLERRPWIEEFRIFPPFDPSPWVDEPYLSHNNCYNYAAQIRFEDEAIAIPGGSQNWCIPRMICHDVIVAARMDGLTARPADTDTEAMVALCCTASGDPDPSFHWYLRHGDGFWSHKDGPTEPVNYDDDGKLILDPRGANRGRYRVFCGFFFADRNRMRLSSVVCHP